MKERKQNGQFLSIISKKRNIESSKRISQRNAEHESETKSNETFVSDVQDSDKVSEENTDNLPNSTLLSGRRIVELDHVVNQLKQCYFCGFELNLIRTKGEKRYGFDSVLSVKCGHCKKDNKVDTNKRQRIAETSRGPPGFVVNTKATIGMFKYSSAIHL